MATQKQSIAFEIGIHHCLLTSDWEALKAIPAFVNTVQKDIIQAQMDALHIYVEKAHNFQSDVKLKRLQARLKALDDYIASERRKCRLLNNLSHLRDITITIE